MTTDKYKYNLEIDGPGFWQTALKGLGAFFGALLSGALKGVAAFFGALLFGDLWLLTNFWVIGVVLLGSGVIIHTWTVTLALKLMGPAAAGTALITPIFAEFSYYSRMIDSTGTAWNPYCTALILWFWFAMVFKAFGIIFTFIHIICGNDDNDRSYGPGWLRKPKNMTDPVLAPFTIETTIYHRLKSLSKIKDVTISELGTRIIAAAAERSEGEPSSREARQLNGPGIFNPFYLEKSAYHGLLDWQKKTGQTRSGLANKAIHDYLHCNPHEAAPART